MTITINFRQLFVRFNPFRRIQLELAELQACNQQFRLGLAKAMVDCEELKKQMAHLRIAEAAKPKPPEVHQAKNWRQVQNFMGETFDAPS